MEPEELDTAIQNIQAKLDTKLLEHWTMQELDHVMRIVHIHGHVVRGSIFVYEELSKRIAELEYKVDLNNKLSKMQSDRDKQDWDGPVFRMFRD